MVSSRRILAPALLATLLACTRQEAQAPPPAACPPAEAPAVAAAKAPQQQQAAAAPARHADLPPCAEAGAAPADLDALEQLALAAERARDFSRMLACANDARRLVEDDAAAVHLQAEALLHLGRQEEARAAFELALALAPHDPWVLAGAADLHANHLPPGRDRLLLALALAERGLAYAPSSERDLRVQLHLISAWSHADLGDHRTALARAEAALELRPGDRDARVAKGRALYELTRFAEATRVLAAVVGERPEDAEAHHLLGLAYERIDGRLADAERHLAVATRLDPAGHPPPAPVDDEGLVELVRAEVAALPPRERALLTAARVPVHVTPLPEVEDLRAVEPPLSPTAVGMYRGPPLGVVADEPREILLFARNLRRAARDEDELREQVRITLLHEVGHLAGEDEAQLRARGLE